MEPTVILLTFNSEDTLGATLASAQRISSEIFVVDSFSKDRTVGLARSLNVTVIQHPFEHYAAQRNWAIDNLPTTRQWQLHLDADEWMDERLVSAIQALRRMRSTPGTLYRGTSAFWVACSVTEE